MIRAGLAFSSSFGMAGLDCLLDAGAGFGCTGAGFTGAAAFGCGAGIGCTGVTAFGCGVGAG